MFGFITAQIDSLSEEEISRYKAVYCGLCRSLKQRYGSLSRVVLSYDFTFYILLCDSLHEPHETTGQSRCIAHPTQLRPYAQSSYSDLAADLTLALAYHKCLDDWQDEAKTRGRLGAKVLESAYNNVKQLHPQLISSIETSMERIHQLETDVSTDPDAVSLEFGKLFGAIFGYDQGFWSDSMALFGAQLGQFIYMMDAAVDLKEDIKSHNYNPFIGQTNDPQTMETLLKILIGRATETFERLPLVNDLHLMESVLYAGVWQQFNKIYNSENDKTKDDGSMDASLKGNQ